MNDVLKKRQEMIEKRQEYHERDLKRRQVLVRKVKNLMNKGVNDVETLMEATGCKSRTIVERAVHAVEIAEKRGIDPVLAQK